MPSTKKKDTTEAQRRASSLQRSEEIGKALREKGHSNEEIYFGKNIAEVIQALEDSEFEGLITTEEKTKIENEIV